MKSARYILSLIAVLLAVLFMVTAIPTWASQGVGSSPYAADLLVSGLNTGKLDPGQEYWYAYSRLDLGDPAYNSIILSLNFEAQGRAIASRVNFQVFDFEQVDRWLQDSSGPVDSLGLGAAASADFDVNTGERMWAGAVAANRVYYVRLFNLSPSPVVFRLTALGQKSAQPEAFLAYNAGVSNREALIIPAAINRPSETELPVTANPTIGATLPVQPDDDSPAATPWLLAAQAIQGLPPQEAAAWLMSAAMLGWLPVGNGGSAALLPVDPNTGQSWPVTGGGGDGAGEGSGAGAAAAAVPAPPDPVKGDNIYPNQPLELLDGANIGRLAPKTEHWYTFSRSDLDEDIIENMSLTMFFTPGEPNIARNVIFEMFTGSQYQIWDRGTPDQMEHFGAGSWLSRDGDYLTGERLWHGSIVDGDRYYVKVTNGADTWIDYHLLTGDIINIEMGPKEKPVEPPDRIWLGPPSGKDIGSPIPITAGHTKGHLAAGEDIWFEFTTKTTQPDKPELQHFVVTLDHTPGAGHITNYVNVEIYPYQEQHIWQRGNTDQIIPLGAGSDLKYDKTSDTHTWVWDGHLISNTTYFMRVRNDSVRAIDYDLLIDRR